MRISLKLGTSTDFVISVATFQYFSPLYRLWFYYSLILCCELFRLETIFCLWYLFGWKPLVSACIIFLNYYRRSRSKSREVLTYSCFKGSNSWFTSTILSTKTFPRSCLFLFYFSWGAKRIFLWFEIDFPAIKFDSFSSYFILLSFASFSGISSLGAYLRMSGI